jgi:hydroxyacylglutathione hydrolase
MRHWNTKSGYKIIQILGGRSNVFLLTNGTKYILVDTGPAFMWNVLKYRLKILNINKVDYLILTHAHFDHAANSKKIKDNFNSGVIIHSLESENLKCGNNPMTDGTNLLSRLIVKGLNKPFAKFLDFKPCESDYLVDSLFDLNILGFNAYILPTPGHTTGSVSIIIDEEIALVGDAMFGIFRNSIFPPFALDTGEMIKSWDKLLKTNCRIFIPSHGSANSRMLVENNYNKLVKCTG